MLQTLATKPRIESHIEADSGRYSDYRPIGAHGIYRLGKIMRYGRWCFVKSLAPEYADDTFCRLLLRKEYELLTELDHPGLPRAIDFRPLPDIGNSLIMEWLNDVPLNEIMRQGLNVSQRRRVVHSLLDVMSYVHSKGVTHSDLRPDIILVNPVTMEARVVGFSLSDFVTRRLLKERPEADYGAPEQFDRYYKPDPRCDVYALGRIIAEMDCGKPYSSIAQECISATPLMRPADAGELLSLIHSRRGHRERRWMIIGAIMVALILAAVFLFKRTISPHPTTLPIPADTTSVAPPPGPSQAPK